MSSLKDVLSSIAYDPINLDTISQPVTLFKCCHRINESDAKTLFGELNSQGRVTKSGTCPECRANVETYAVDHKIKELASSLTSSFIAAQFDAAEDIELHRLGAANGNVNSSYLLGEFYLKPGGKTPPDPKLGISYIQDAARRGHAGAKMRLFRLYAEQKLGDVNLDRTVLLECIAFQGTMSNSSRLELGQLLEKGYGLPNPDFSSASQQYLIAFYNKAPESPARLMHILSNLNNQEQITITLLNKPEFVYPNLNTQELIELIVLAKKINSEFLPNFIKEAIALSQPSPIKWVEVALVYYKESWAQDYLKSQVNSTDKQVVKKLGEAYLAHREIMTLTQEESFQLVARGNFPNNHLASHVFMGTYHYDKKNYANAITELELAASLNHMDSILLLGLIHEKMSNYALAFQKYDQAAQNRNGEGLYKRGTFYQFGLNGEQNLVKAKDDFEKGWRLGSSKALVAYITLLHEEKAYREAYDCVIQYQTFPVAEVLHGICYLRGFYVAKDVKYAEKLFLSSATDLTNCLIAKAYLEENEEANFNKYLSKVSKDCPDPTVYFLQGQMYERLDLEKSLGYYLKAAEQGLGEAKKRIGELFFNRKIPPEVKIPIAMFEVCCALIRPGSASQVHDTLKGIYLCTGLGLDQKDVNKGIQIISGVIKANPGIITFISELFTNTSNDRGERDKAYEVLKNNKSTYLSDKSVQKVAAFLQLVPQGTELQEWMTHIKRLAPPAFLDKLAEELTPTVISAFSPGLKMTSMRKKATANCTIL